jgi:hypothetical protein
VRCGQGGVEKKKNFFFSLQKVFFLFELETENFVLHFFQHLTFKLLKHNKTVLNGKEANINRALDGSTYPG